MHSGIARVKLRKTVALSQFKDSCVICVLRSNVTSMMSTVGEERARPSRGP